MKVYNEFYITKKKGNTNNFAISFTPKFELVIGDHLYEQFKDEDRHLNAYCSNELNYIEIGWLVYWMRFGLKKVYKPVFGGKQEKYDRKFRFYSEFKIVLNTMFGFWFAFLPQLYFIRNIYVDEIRPNSIVFRFLIFNLSFRF